MLTNTNRRRVTFPPPGGAGQMRTKQSHKAECDIHNILGQYRRTGIITHVAAMRPTYEDLPAGVDFQQAMNTILEAQAVFQDLPAKVREHFRNDPALFLGAFQDEKQHDTLREYGLLKAKAAPQPSEAPPAPSEE